MNTVSTKITMSLSSYGKTVNKQFPVIFEHSLDESITIIKVDNNDQITQGVLKNNTKYNKQNVPRTKLTFYKVTDTYYSKEKKSIKYIYEDSTEYYNAITYNDSPNNIVYDYCFSDDNGNYTAYLEPGIYKIRVETPFKHYFMNINIDEGLTNYYEYTTDAHIKEKIDDTILLYGTDKVLISGCLFDEYNNPYAGQIVISQNNKLIVFINSEDGNYNFLLNYGTYDVRIRSERQSVQIYYDYVFSPGQGFFTNLLKHKITGYTQEQIDSLLINQQLSNNLIADNWTNQTR